MDNVLGIVHTRKYLTSGKKTYISIYKAVFEIKDRSLVTQVWYFIVLVLALG